VYTKGKEKAELFAFRVAREGNKEHCGNEEYRTRVVDNSCNRLVVSTTRDQRRQADGGALAIRAADCRSAGWPVTTLLIRVFVAERNGRTAAVNCYVGNKFSWMKAASEASGKFFDQKTLCEARRTEPTIVFASKNHMQPERSACEVCLRTRRRQSYTTRDEVRAESSTCDYKERNEWTGILPKGS
jgi:hypothetical protein